LSGTNDNRPELNDPNEPCRYCKKTNHTVKDCSRLADKKNRESGKIGLDTLAPIVTNVEIRKSNIHGSVAGPGQENHGNTVSNVAAGDTDDDLVYLEVLLDGVPRVCLCDTGSELSFIPLRLVDRGNITPKKTRIRAANGIIIDILGSCQVNVQIGDSLNVDSSFIVSTHMNIPVLGMDWMIANATGWDFSAGFMLIKGMDVKLQSAASVKSCRKIVLVQKSIIPPWSQYIVEGRVETNDLKRRRNTLWMTQPRMLDGVIMVGSVTLPGNTPLVSLVLLNSSDKSITLEEDVCLAHLEAVEFCEGSLNDNCKEAGVMKLEVIEDDSPETSPDYIQTMMGNVHGYVTAEHKAKLEALINKYSDIFSKSEFDLGETPLGIHRIDTGDAKPVRQTLRRQPYDLVPKIDAYVEDMCKAGIIEPSSSPWSSNLVVVKKKDGSYRYCVDYRKLNSLTRRDAYPLPRIDACLDTLSGSDWFSTFDLRASYHQVPMHPDDADKTSFVTRTGTYRFK